jgi:hypothetical protein
MILISIFSGNFLSSLVNQDFKNIESFQELVNSNLTIISGNSSYFQYINKTLSHNNLVTLLNERAIFVNDHNVSQYLLILNNRIINKQIISRSKVIKNYFHLSIYAFNLLKKLKL